MRACDKVRELLCDGAPEMDHKTPGAKTTGTVVYIHPGERFYVVRFDFPAGSFRESFYFPDRATQSEKEGRAK